MASMQRRRAWNSMVCFAEASGAGKRPLLPMGAGIAIGCMDIQFTASGFPSPLRTMSRNFGVLVTGCDI